MFLLLLWPESAAAHPCQSVPERPHPVRIQQRVDGRVGVGEQNGPERERHGDLALWAQQQDAVDAVDGEPAHREQKQDQEERSGLAELPADSHTVFGRVGRSWTGVGRPRFGSGACRANPGHRLCVNSSALCVNNGPDA